MKIASMTFAVTKNVIKTQNVQSPPNTVKAALACVNVSTGIPATGTITAPTLTNVFSTFTTVPQGQNVQMKKAVLPVPVWTAMKATEKNA
jgi:hypothetical protein